MPTVILLDTSLSMCRPVQMADISESYQFRNLVVHGLNFFLDYMNINCKLEFAALMSCSPVREIIVQFTRDFDSIKAALMQLECYEKACIINALEGVQSLILEEWGAGIPSQVILITDGHVGAGRNSLKCEIEKYVNAAEKGDEIHFPLPFPFPGKLHILCISNPSDPSLQTALPLYQKLIDISGGGSQVICPEGVLNFKSVQQMFTKLADMYYKPFHGTLRCGNLTSNVSLSPSPEPYNKSRDFDIVKAEMSTDIVICGFIGIADVSSPPSLSRHLVLPVIQDEPKPVVTKPENAEGTDEESTSEDGKQPSFCVLLHGSLKVEGMVAICHLGAEWYGMLYSWADSKKKSNLMLSTFEPGLDIIPWLGSFTNMGPIATEASNGTSDPEIQSFPLKPSEKRSYAQNCVVWIKQSGLQADIQKILRHARKLPEKTQNFYKELNRLRRASLSFGFYELLEGMATILDRECTLLPGSAHPDAALQLTHCANALRATNQDFNTPVLPLRTKFSMDD